MMKPTTHKSLTTTQSYLLTLQLLMAMTLINKNMGAVCANAVTPEIPTVSDNENEYSDIMMPDDGFLEEKRNWQSLQGSWGKRTQNDNDHRAQKNRNWQSLQGSWGKRSQADNDLSGDEMMDSEQVLPILITTNVDSKPKTQMAFLANPLVWEHVANQQNSMPAVGSNGIDDENIFNDKRGWKQMSTAWGKRRNAGQSWNRDLVSAPSSTGSWGKREPNWGNLKGMWGKRSGGNGWLKLNNGWGKRSQHYTETN